MRLPSPIECSGHRALESHARILYDIKHIRLQVFKAGNSGSIPFENEMLGTSSTPKPMKDDEVKQRNPQIRKRCAFVRRMLYYFISIRQLGIKATYCINYAELFSYVTV